MRNAFASEITRLAGDDPRVVVLSADIGNRLFDTFKARHPRRFYNTGIAEANTISMAAGLASCGLRPVCYTIAPFITARCFEQIRVDVCYHHVPVVIVGTGAGLSYASLGATHHSLEDLAILRTLPNLRIAVPADAAELRSCLAAALASEGPVYVRIGKKGEPLLHEEPPRFAFGSWNVIRTGSRVALLSTGTMLATAISATDHLVAEGIRPTLINCASFKPLDEGLLAIVVASHDLVITLEEHGRIGGFGAAIAEWVSELPAARTQLIRFGTPDEFLHAAGGQHDTRDALGLGAPEIARRVIQALVRPVMAAELATSSLT